MILVLIIALIANPVLAYNSGDAIIITRKAPRKKALLDRKFVFIQESPAFKQGPSLRTERSNPGSIQKLSHSNLGSLSNPIKQTVTIVNKQNSKSESLSQSSSLRTKPELQALLETPQGARNDAKPQDIYDESSWDNYATETDDNLGVRAWITNLQD